MYSIKKKSVFIVCIIWILTPLASHSAVVLKTKNNQVLIHLEGLRTKKGAYFSAINMYGKRRGFVKITRVGQKKAIGVVKLGQAVKRWSLEPVSRREVQTVTRRIARIQKEKMRRRMARLQRERREKQRLANQKRRARRSLASYEDQEEYLLDDLPEERFNYQSPEVLSYSEKPKNPPLRQAVPSHTGDQSNFIPQSQNAYNNNVHLNQNPSHQNPSHQVSKVYQSQASNSFRLILGLSPGFEYNFMKITPPGKRESYLMQGISFGLFGNLGFSLNEFIRMEGLFGFKQFSASTTKDVCKSRKDCFLKINYAVSGLALKLNFLSLSQHKFWFALKGNLMYPIQYNNQSPIKSDSFFPFHGSMGGALGIDFTIGNIFIPLSLETNVYIPPTATVFTGNAGLRLGLAYQF